MSETQPGRVVISYGREAIVEDGQGELQRCNLRRSVGRPVCGDYVLWRASSESDGVIEKIQERQNILARPDYRAKLRPLAANIDLMVIVVGTEPEFTRELLDRYLVLAASLDINACIWLNKIDLAEPARRAALEALLEQYRRLDYPVLIGSTKTGEGMPELAQQLNARTSVLVGQSGVGKSSLTKALLPDLEIRIGALSHASGQGRHTTTETTLYHLAAGGDLIDSPGIRTLRLGHLQPEQIAEGFIEFRAHLGNCRFKDCKHSGEPDCAIDAAVAAGSVDRARLASFRAIVANEESQRY